MTARTAVTISTGIIAAFFALTFLAVPSDATNTWGSCAHDPCQNTSPRCLAPTVQVDCADPRCNVGPCDSRPSPQPTSPVYCTQQYDPVCGVDGQTYPNRCVAEGQSGVAVAYPGECRPTPTSTPYPAPQPTYRPCPWWRAWWGCSPYPQSDTCPWWAFWCPPTTSSFYSSYQPYQPRPTYQPPYPTYQPVPTNQPYYNTPAIPPSYNYNPSIVNGVTQSSFTYYGPRSCPPSEHLECGGCSPQDPRCGCICVGNAPGNGAPAYGGGIPYVGGAAVALSAQPYPPAGTYTYSGPHSCQYPQRLECGRCAPQDPTCGCMCATDTTDVRTYLY